VEQFGAIGARMSLRLGGDAAHRGGQKRPIADASLFPVKLCGPLLDQGDIVLSRTFCG
jgi:hypothetical protein